jgi:hypothetical protein
MGTLSPSSSCPTAKWPCRPWHAAGRRVVAKQGGQPGANTYLRIYPDDDVVVVVLTNRWHGGHSSHQLSADIGDLVLGS